MSFVEALREADRLEWPTVSGIYYSPFKVQGDGERPCGCAIGAACFVAERLLFEDRDDGEFSIIASPETAGLWDATNVWGNGWGQVGTGEPAGSGPCGIAPCKGGEDDDTKTVAHLFDDHHWSYSEIADWLERIGVGTMKPSEMAATTATTQEGND